MEKELSYLTPEGYTVFTSQFLKNRGTCCRSACLHCPFGYTLKKHGLQFLAVTENQHEIIESILAENSQTLEWKSFMPDNVLLVQLKNEIAGFVLKNHIVVKNVVLKKHFQHQNLSKEMIESYLFI